MKFIFDGYGINDAEDDYRSRVANMTAHGQTLKAGHVLAAAPDLLAEAKRNLAAFVEFQLIGSGDQVLVAERIRDTRSAISRAEGRT